MPPPIAFVIFVLLGGLVLSSPRARNSLRQVRSVIMSLSSGQLTAIATSAAAIAGGAAVWASLRQEKATFDSYLYSKQIEIVSDASTTMNHTVEQISPVFVDTIAFNSNFLEDPDGVLRSAKDLANLLEALDASRTTAAHFVLPEDYDSLYYDTLSLMSDMSKRMYFLLSEIRDTHSDFNDSKFNSAKEQFTPMWNRVFENTHVFTNCAAYQLRKGHYLTSLQDCPSVLRKCEGKACYNLPLH